MNKGEGNEENKELEKETGGEEGNMEVNKENKELKSETR